MVRSHREEMVDTFIASIPTMQTDIALLKQDMSTVKKQGETLIETIESLSVVTKTEFDEHRNSVEGRLHAIEKYHEDTKPGVKFINTLVSKWLTFLSILLLASAVIALIGKFVPLTNIPL